MYVRSLVQFTHQGLGLRLGGAKAGAWAEAGGVKTGAWDPWANRMDLAFALPLAVVLGLALPLPLALPLAVVLGLALPLPLAVLPGGAWAGPCWLCCLGQRESWAGPSWLCCQVGLGPRGGWASSADGVCQ